MDKKDDKKKLEKLPKIKSKKQLDEIFDDLYSQGFGYLQSYKAHDNKINKIISDNNKLNIDYSDHQLKKLIYDIDSYDEINNIINEYFSKFNSDDKIIELLNTFYLVPDSVVTVPDRRWPDRKDIFNWVKFRKKWNIKEEPNVNWNFKLYNLDKSYVKVNDGGRATYQLDTLYELLYGKKPTRKIDDKDYGSWQYLGEIEVKLFKNGSINIKGNIKKLKEFLYKQIGKSCLVIYNKKREIRES